MLRITSPKQIQVNQKLLIISRNNARFEIKSVDTVESIVDDTYTYKNKENKQYSMSMKALLECFEVYSLPSSINVVEFMNKYTGTEIDLISSQFSDEVIKFAGVAQWEDIAVNLRSDVDYFFRFVNWYYDFKDMIFDLHFDSEIYTQNAFVTAMSQSKNDFKHINIFA